MPGVANVWLGFCWLASGGVVLSPKFQLQVAMDPPCRGLLRSEKRQATPTVHAGTVKAAVGGGFVGAATVTVLVTSSVWAASSVTVSLTWKLPGAWKVWS